MRTFNFLFEKTMIELKFYKNIIYQFSIVFEIMKFKFLTGTKMVKKKFYLKIIVHST